MRILLRAVRVGLAVPVVLFAVMPGRARAQRGINVERFTPALDSDGFLGVQASRTPGPGRWNFGLWTSATTNPLIVRAEDGTETDVIDARVTTDFQFQIGVGGRLALAFDIPLVLYQDASAAPLGDGLGAIPSNAMGDPRLVARYRILGQDSRVDRERNEGGGVALQAAGTVPIGDEDAFGSEHGVTTELTAIADFHVLGAGASAALGWRHRFETRQLLGVTFRDEIELGLALKLPIPVTRDFFAIIEARGITDAGSPFGEQATTAVEGDLGVRIKRGDVALTGALGTGWTGGVGSPSFRAILGATWTPRVHDSDGDTIPDDRDQCPYLPEDFDGFQDLDGCLDPDNDNDMIPDLDDRCPNEEAVEFRDEDEDGCTDPIRDADGDGVEDSEDSCPRAAEDADGFQDEDGCPDPDNDDDGIDDQADQCPEAAEDVDGFQDEDGCPDADNDGDGMPDAQDRCPDAAEDADGFEDEDGCPDPDNDRDGVRDEDDRCAGRAETINGVDDGDGCPDRGGRARWRVQHRGQDDERILGTIVLSAQGTLSRRSIPAVDQLARLLIARWPARFLVQIGSQDATAAASLQSAIVERGVPAGRIHVQGDAALRGSRVVVVRAPVQETRPQQAPPSQAPPGP